MSLIAASPHALILAGDSWSRAHHLAGDSWSYSPADHPIALGLVAAVLLTCWTVVAIAVALAVGPALRRAWERREFRDQLADASLEELLDGPTPTGGAA